MSGNYDIGYGKPPKATQFKPGQSGNRKGRPKGRKNTLSYMKEVLSKKVIMQENGRPVKKTVIEAVAMRLAEKAAKGDVKAMSILFHYSEEIDAKEEHQDRVNEVLSTEDQAILEDFKRRAR